MFCQVKPVRTCLLPVTYNPSSRRTKSLWSRGWNVAKVSAASSAQSSGVCQFGVAYTGDSGSEALGLATFLELVLFPGCFAASGDGEDWGFGREFDTELGIQSSK